MCACKVHNNPSVTQSQIAFAPVVEYESELVSGMVDSGGFGAILVVVEGDQHQTVQQFAQILQLVL